MSHPIGVGRTATPHLYSNTHNIRFNVFIYSFYLSSPLISDVVSYAMY